MRISWLGHAAFQLSFDSGVRFALDPYADTPAYPPLRTEADYVTISHSHGDHNNPGAVKGYKQLIDKPGSYDCDGIAVRGILTAHDDAGGAKRGPNIVFAFDADGIRLCHLGDLGTPPTPEQIAEIGPVDVLMVPVGGYYTIDATAAALVCDQLAPKLVIPMHYSLGNVESRIAPVGTFLSLVGGEKTTGNSIEVTRTGLAGPRRTVVLNYC